MAIELAEEAQQESGTALTPVADAVTTALAEITKTNTTFTELAATGRELAERYRDVVADVRTVKGYQQIAAIRTELREKVRFPMQRLQKSGSKMLGDIRKQFNERAEALIAEAESHEAPFQELLDAEDARKEAERREREEAERRRKDGHLQAIAAINRIAMEAVGLSIAELEQRIASTKEIIVDESYEEFQGQAMQAKDEALRQLQGLLIAARADEDDRREAEEARQRQAAFAQQQAEAARAAEAKAAEERAAREQAEREAQELREKVAAMERAEQERKVREESERQERERATQERADAIEARMQRLRMTGGAYSHMAPSANIQQALEELQATTITAEFFGDRVAEALTVRHDVLNDLAAVRMAAERREAEEAEQAQRTRRSEMLSNVVGMGENALLAVQDGSAEVAQLQRNRVVLETLDLTDDLWGDLLPQAVGARSEALRKTDEAIAQTQERDRLAAEEEERRRQEAEAIAAENAREARIVESAARMYQVLKGALPLLLVAGCVIEAAEMQAIVDHVEGV